MNFMKTMTAQKQNKNYICIKNIYILFVKYY